MKTWSLSSTDPICLTLSADARFGGTDYGNDQIWELGWWETDITALWLRSSFGRRAQSIHIFPAISLGGATRQDPGVFSQPLRLTQILPNLASVACSPFNEIELVADYYIVDSHAVVGRFTLNNLSANPQVVNLRLSAYLQPGELANPMGLVEREGVATLAGRATNFFPLVMISGAARKVSSAYPSLQVAATLAPLGTKTWVWAHVGLLEERASFERARELIQIPWDPTMARLEMGNARMLHIETGDADLNCALWMSQKELLRSFIGPTPHNSRPGLIARRGIDDGYALSSDGKDHSGAWGGVDTATTYYLAKQALPIVPEFVKDLLRNILRTQNPAGELDWAPGLGGQRAGYQAIPLIATLAWEIFLWTEDQAFLEEIFPGLFSFYESWFTDAHDRDGDGFPEWDHAIQTGFEDRPLFNRFDSWAEGFDITHAEAVDLASYLYREGRSLISIASELNREGLTAVIRDHMSVLMERVESSWSEKKSTYLHVDRDSHVSHDGLQLVKRRGESSTQLDRMLEPAARLVLRLKGDPQLAKKIKVEIVSQGLRKRKRTESLTFRRFQSFWQWSTHTTAKLNQAVHDIKVTGIDQKMTLEIRVPDLTRQDISQALPLWAGLLDDTSSQALIRNSLLNSSAYWRANGLSSIPASDTLFEAQDDQGGVALRMLWNSLIGSGLIEQGYRVEAAQLFEKLSQPVIDLLKAEKHFFSRYHADETRGLGVRGGLEGILPIDMFLAILGIRLISPTKLWVMPGNPFPWPVKVEWQGLSLYCEPTSVQIRFPDGQEVTVDGGEGRFVEQLERSTDSLPTSEA